MVPGLATVVEPDVRRYIDDHAGRSFDILSFTLHPNHGKVITASFEPEP